MENENEVITENTVEAQKSEEQIASENNLNLSINDNAEIEQAAEVAQESLINANNVIKEVLTVVPIGLHLAGLKNAAAAWSGDACGLISVALVPVLRKYAFGQRILAYLETGGGIAEGALLMALWPVASATYAGYLVDKAEKEANPDESKNAVHDANTPLGSTYRYEESAKL